MNNKEISQIFREIADMLEIQGGDFYRVNAYRRAADSIEHHPVALEELWKEGRLREVPRVGEAIAKKIDELLSTGQLGYYEELKEQVPDGVLSLLTIPGVGPKTAKLLHEKLGLASIPEVEHAAREERLRHLPGLRARSEEKILHGIEMLHRLSGRSLLGTALPIAQEIVERLRATSPAENIVPVGSLRRRKPTIGDIDILATTAKPTQVMSAFVKLSQVAEVLLQGDTKSTVILDNGLQVDLRVLSEERFGTLMQYFTGSKEHNVQLRILALDQGLSLSEYGYKKEDGTEITCPTEEEVYETIGLPWIPPEMREARGEIEAARAGKLPQLVTDGDIRGDFHVHTNYSDGVHTIEEMAQAAKAKGYDYILLTDHTRGLGVAGGMTPERVAEQRAEIKWVNEKLAPFRVLAGAEVEIRSNGTLDLPDEVLAEMDLVVAAIHSGLRQEREKITQRMLAAIRNPHVDIIAHPTGRLLGQREEIALDFEAVVREAAKTGTILEINAQPNRLDLDGAHVMRAIQEGVLLSIGTDAHHMDGLGLMPLGVAMARRGWAEAKDIANTMNWEDLKKKVKR